MFFSISETVTYQTTLTPYEVSLYLNEVIEPPKTFRWSFWGSSKPYQGTADQYAFKMHKIPQGKNSTFAQAEGTIREERNHTIVEVQISMPIFLRIFAVVWLGFVGMFGMVSLFAPISNKMPMPFQYIPVAMFVFGTALFFGGYKWHAHDLKHDLKRILQAEFVEDW
jgi:hypothetical protein